MAEPVKVISLPGSARPVAVEAGRPSLDGATVISVLTSTDSPPPTPVPTTEGFTFIQAMAANPWVIDHHLGFPPGGVVVFDSDGNQIETEISYPDPPNRLVVHFPFGMSLTGTAYLS